MYNINNNNYNGASSWECAKLHFHLLLLSNVIIINIIIIISIITINIIVISTISVNITY